jgi:hypothetical protein
MRLEGLALQLVRSADLNGLLPHGAAGQGSAELKYDQNERRPQDTN